MAHSKDVTRDRRSLKVTKSLKKYNPQFSKWKKYFGTGGTEKKKLCLREQENNIEIYYKFGDQLSKK